MNSDNDNISQKTDAHPAVFAVILASIQPSLPWTIEKGKRVSEVNPMFANVFLTLVFVPLESQTIIVNTKCTCVNGSTRMLFVKLQLDEAYVNKR